MSVVYCENCQRYIDTDFDAEHFDDCVEDVRVITHPVKRKELAMERLESKKWATKHMNECECMEEMRQKERREELKARLALSSLVAVAVLAVSLVVVVLWK